MTKAKQKPKKANKGKEEPPISVENKGQSVDALESSGTTNPTQIFQPPQVSQNLRNNAKPWFQTEILSMM
mgnify:FL=1